MSLNLVCVVVVKVFKKEERMIWVVGVKYCSWDYVMFVLWCYGVF